MKLPNKIKQTAMAILVLGVISTSIFYYMSGRGFQILLALKVFIFTVMGPLNYPILFGSYDASILEIITLTLFLVVPVLLYYHWYNNNRHPVILGLTVFLWVGFGGFLSLAKLVMGI